MKKLSFFGLLKGKSKIVLPLLGLLGVVNGLWSGGLLMLINNKVAGTPLPFLDDYDWLVYLVLIISSLVLAYFFQAYMLKMTLDFGKELELSIYSKLRFAQYESYVQLGEEKIRTAIQDVNLLGTFPQVFLSSFNSLVMIVIGVGYLFWVFPKGALVILLLILVLSGLYVYRSHSIERNVDAIRTLSDTYMKNVNDFILGYKKMKMSTKRSDAIYFNHIEHNRSKFIKLLKKVQLASLVNNLIGDYAFYLGIGVVLFILPLLFGVNQEVLSNYLTTILFLMGPIAIFIDFIEQFIRFKVSIGRINDFNETLNTKMQIDTTQNIPVDAFPKFESITFENVGYTYHDKNKDVSFSLEPSNIKILKGEVVFIFGGNGSGKSTFINILSGLFIPESGHMYYNEQEITDSNRSSYRDTLSSIFADDYLFSENYDNLDLRPSNEELNYLLTKMGLVKAISLSKKNNTISNDLSSGQKKRLSLIYSIMEDKDVFIFDEWAAEQDPDFRRYFYTTIIPELKQNGKTVIAITHDDAYYHCCDRLLKFDYGKILEGSFSELVAQNFVPVN